MNRISVIIPVYNGEKYIAEAIESILNQTLPAYEIIVIDDGSTDNTAKIVKEYNIIKYFYQPNSGVSVARNLGIHNANGKYIMLLDHDDFYPQNKIELCLNQFQQNPDVAVVNGVIQIVFDNKEIQNSFYAVYPRLQSNDILPRSALVGSAMFKREVLLEIGGFNPEMRSAEDIEIWVKLNQKQVRISYINDVCLFYRRHDNNMTRQPGFANASAKNTLLMLHKSLKNRKF